MVVFRCKRSGNTVSFSLPQDIEGLRKHEGYEEVKEPEITPEKTAAPVDVKKQRGRPKKV